MKLRSFFSALLAVVLVLLLIGGSGFFWLRARSPLALSQRQDSLPAATRFVPRQAPITLSLLINPERLGAFQQAIAAPKDRQRSRTEFNQLQQNLLGNTGLNYQKDIQPWIGDEVTFAVTTLDIDRQSENGQQPGYLLALATRNPERSQEFLELFWQQQALAGRDLVFEQYQGVKLISAGPRLTDVKSSGKPDKPTPPPLNSLATARIGRDFVLFANHPKVLRSAINNIQVPDLELSNAKPYQQAVASLEQGRIGLAFLNLPELSAWRTQPPKGAEAAEQTSAPVYDSLAIALGLNRQGLLAETALMKAAGSETQLSRPLLSRPVQALKYIPATSPLVVASLNLAQLWSQIHHSLLGYGLIADLINPSLQAATLHWKLDLPQDIFAWVEGEYALAMIPRPLTLDDRSQVSADWLFVAESTQPEKAQSAIKHLDQIAEQQGLGVSPLTLEEQKIATWTRLVTQPAQSVLPEPGLKVLGTQVIGAHTTVDDYKILSTSLEALDQSLKAPQKSLADTKIFQQAIAPLAQPNHGYLYLDWPGSRPILEQRFPVLRAIEVAGSGFFNHLRSLSLSSYGEAAGAQRSQIFIRLF
jgi:hypothetical protein